jgi:hypothetical protein
VHKKIIALTTLETSGEDRKTTLETSGEDHCSLHIISLNGDVLYSVRKLPVVLGIINVKVYGGKILIFWGKTTLETSGEDFKTTLESGEEDLNLHSKRVGNFLQDYNSIGLINPQLRISPLLKFKTTLETSVVSAVCGDDSVVGRIFVALRSGEVHSYLLPPASQIEKTSSPLVSSVSSQSSPPVSSVVLKKFTSFKGVKNSNYINVLSAGHVIMGNCTSSPLVSSVF